LAQRNLHTSSVKLWTFVAKSAAMNAADKEL
jgi:hypothetical protein